MWDQRFRVYHTLAEEQSLELRALGDAAKPLRLPAATPSLWHLDALAFVPYMEDTAFSLPDGARVEIGFAPAKPLAAAPFWWLNGS
mgnify:FL=1